MFKHYCWIFDSGKDDFRNKDLLNISCSTLTNELLFDLLQNINGASGLVNNMIFIKEQL